MVGTLSFVCLTTPDSLSFYLLVVLLEFGNTLEFISIKATFTKNLERNTRGTMHSVHNLFSCFGLMIFAKLTGYAYDNYGHEVPFYLIGGFDCLFALAVIGLALAGKFRD